MRIVIRVNGRRYGLRSKGTFAFCLTAALLLAVGLVCLIGGLMAQASGDAAARTIATGRPAHTEGLAMAQPEGSVSESPSVQTYGVHAGVWNLVLVNATHPLPGGFYVETRELPNGLGIDSRVYDDLMAMVGDAKSQGLSLVICSAYRTVEKQQELFDAEVAAKEAGGLSHDSAVAAAKTAVAQPGTSEHNLGLAADIVALAYQKLDEGYLNTPECKWLAENSWKYGFIMRYPEGKSDITKIVFEPWHYRYVGKEAAEEIKEQGVCLEEYLGETD